MQTPANNLREAHLTDEQFTDLLLGTIPAPVSEHLKLCACCAEEAERVSGAIAGFERHSREWADLRAASRPPLATEPKPAFAWLHDALRPRMWAGASLAVALVVGVAAGIRTETRLMHREDRASASPSAPAAVEPVQQTTQAQETAQAQPPARPAPHAARLTPATLKADNELLSAIDGELSAEAAPSASVYGLTVSGQPVRSRIAKRIAN